MKTHHIPAVLFCFAVFIVAFFFPSSIGYAALPSGFSTEVVASGLSVPTIFDFAPDGRIFVAEKNGVVRIIKNGQVLPVPFITLPHINTHGDRGLIGMALDRDFTHNGFVYLSYTHENNAADPFGPKTSRIVRVKASGDVADMSTFTVIVGTVAGSPSAPSCHNVPVTADCIPSDSSSHSVGGLRFGDDGYLYASTGDGAGFTFVDPNALLSQNIDSLAGKFLRLNRDGTAAPGNPYFDGNPNSNRSKVWAYGMRNPYRFNFRPSTGALYSGDVGWYYWEEVNVIKPGRNYGWPCKEGTIDHPGYACAPSGPGIVTPPIYQYERNYALDPHDAIAITGGDFIYAPFPSAYHDNYIFSDFHRNAIYRMVVDSNDTVISVEEWTRDAAGPVAMMTGPDGFLYYLSIFSGELRRIAYRTDRPPIINVTTSSLTGAAPLTVTFDASASTDPDGTPLTFLWDMGDGTFVSGPTAVRTYSIVNNYEVVLTVVDGNGNIARESFIVLVNDGSASGAVAPTLESLTLSVHPLVVGSIVDVVATIKNNGDGGAYMALLNVYDATTNQLVKTNSKLLTSHAGGTRTFTTIWIPEYSGTFFMSVGLFEQDWSEVLEWNDRVRTVSVADREPPSHHDPFTPTHLETRVTPASPVAPGTPLTLSFDVRNNGDVGSGWALVTVSDATATNLFEAVLPLSLAVREQKTLATGFTPTTAGTFYVDVGLFSSDWSVMYQWAWHSASLIVASSTGGQPFAPLLGSTSVTHTGTVGAPATMTAVIGNNGSAGSMNALVIVHDGARNLFEQARFVTLAAQSTTTITESWTPSAPGTYYLDVGLFSSDWSVMYQWAWRAKTFTVTGGGPVVPLSLSLASTTLQSAAAVGTAVPIAASVTNTGGAGVGNVFVVINDGTTNVFEKVFGDQSFASGQTRSYTESWTPSAPGTYYLDVGLFSSDWSVMYQWAWRSKVVVVSGGSAGSGTVTIFDDSLGAGVSDWSWDATVNKAATTPVASGSRSIGVTYTGAWGGLFLPMSAVSVSGTGATLRFFIHGGASGGQKLQVHVFGPSGIYESFALPDLEDGWEEVVLPLTVTPSFHGLIVQGRSGQIEAPFFIDSVRLERP